MANTDTAAAAVRLAIARRDAIAAAADDPDMWADADARRRYVALVRAANVYRIDARSIAVGVTLGRDADVWGSGVTTDILDATAAIDAVHATAVISEYDRASGRAVVAW